ncbi:hypothetical protein PRIPAC_75713 [Pristionchus pacificus]|uniref:Uncharacterized protein n=1 Tax=Pristionchus pacificus TaxID=54126 RepID=A0A2A6BEQ2_PRIPA|nr:hypothetical protein PRIPAC_75713 [Pristionchus pacificus]|eukprot:PDM64380.1 hypothetical protein PRIPAC_52636 [Pristionchus pacificus]
MLLPPHGLEPERDEPPSHDKRRNDSEGDPKEQSAGTIALTRSDEKLPSSFPPFDEDFWAQRSFREGSPLGRDKSLLPMRMEASENSPLLLFSFLRGRIVFRCDDGTRAMTLCSSLSFFLPFSSFDEGFWLWKSHSGGIRVLSRRDVSLFPCLTSMTTSGRVWRRGSERLYLSLRLFLLFTEDSETWRDTNLDTVGRGRRLALSSLPSSMKALGHESSLDAMGSYVRLPLASLPLSIQ